MITIVEVFGCIELAIIVFGIALTFLPEMASLIGCAVLAYGTGINALAFLVTTVVHDHIHMHFSMK